MIWSATKSQRIDGNISKTYATVFRHSIKHDEISAYFYNEK